MMFYLSSKLFFLKYCLFFECFGKFNKNFFLINIFIDIFTFLYYQTSLLYYITALLKEKGISFLPVVVLINIIQRCREKCWPLPLSHLTLFFFPLYILLNNLHLHLRKNLKKLPNINK